MIVDFYGNSASLDRGLRLPNSCCMICLFFFKSKTDLYTDTGILSSAGYNCEIVYNHEKYLLLRLLLVQHLTVSVSIWFRKKKEKKKASKCQNENLFNRICRSAIRI